MIEDCEPRQSWGIEFRTRVTPGRAALFNDRPVFKQIGKKLLQTIRAQTSTRFRCDV
jgi:hypothetical protein